MAPSAAEYALEGVRLLASLVYVLVGSIVMQRQVDPRDRSALVGFGLWWIGLGVIGFYSIPFGLGLEIAELGLTAYRFYIYTLFPLLFLALGGLMYYLTYLYVGHRAVLPAVAAFYLALLLVTVWLVEGFGPYIGTDPETGTADVLFRMEHPAWLTLVFGLALVVPPIVGAVAYLLLWRKVDERAARYRIGMVSTGILVWFGYSLFSTVLRFMTGGGAQTLTGQAISQALGLVSSLMVLAAFVPPAPVQRWLHATPS